MNVIVVAATGLRPSTVSPGMGNAIGAAKGSAAGSVWCASAAVLAAPRDGPGALIGPVSGWIAAAVPILKSVIDHHKSNHSGWQVVWQPRSEYRPPGISLNSHSFLMRQTTASQRAIKRGTGCPHRAASLPVAGGQQDVPRQRRLRFLDHFYSAGHADSDLTPGSGRRDIRRGGMS